MNIYDMYITDVGAEHVTSVSGGKEYRGPCPVCGGTDRFGVWPQQDKFGTFYCGRGKQGGNGCGIGGDAIQYLRDCRGYTFREASEFLGVEVQNLQSDSYKYQAPVLPKAARKAKPVPKDIIWPADVVDPDLWVEHASKFVNACHDALLKRQTAIAYLLSRGISRRSIDKFKLGFHLGEERNGQAYQPSFRPWPSWGLKDEKKDNGRSRMIMLPAGLVIPNFVDGVLREVEIRLLRPDPQQPKKKYHYVKGSCRPVWLTNPQAKAFVLQEAKLDCIAVDDAVGDVVGTIGLGTTGVQADKRVVAAMQDAYTLLDALDFDDPKRNSSTGCMERAGTKAGVAWSQQFSQYKRWPVPVGKDAGDAFKEGVDLRSWIMAGLPPVLHDAPAVQEQIKPEPKPQPEPEKPEPEPKKEEQQPDPQQPAPDLPTRTLSSDVVELRELLREANGYFRIYDFGDGVGPALNPSWSAEYPEKRRRITELLFTSAAVGNLIANLADGVYGAANIPG